MLKTSDVDWDGRDWLKADKCWNEPLLKEDCVILFLFLVVEVYLNSIICEFCLCL